MSESYALFSLKDPGEDATTAAVRNIAARQLPDGQCRPAGIRPPLWRSLARRLIHAV